MIDVANAWLGQLMALPVMDGRGAIIPTVRRTYQTASDQDIGPARTHPGCTCGTASTVARHHAPTCQARHPADCVLEVAS